MSESHVYPGISQIAFSDFYANSGFFDKVFTLAACDRLFIAANFDVSTKDDIGENSTSELIRYEFMEVICRIAKLKFIDSGHAADYP